MEFNMKYYALPLEAVPIQKKFDNLEKFLLSLQEKDMSQIDNDIPIFKKPHYLINQKHLLLLNNRFKLKYKKYYLCKLSKKNNLKVNNNLLYYNFTIFLLKKLQIRFKVYSENNLKKLVLVYPKSLQVYFDNIIKMLAYNPTTLKGFNNILSSFKYTSIHTALPTKIRKFTLAKSPHIFKKAMEQYEKKTYRFVLKSNSNIDVNLSSYKNSAFTLYNSNIVNGNHYILLNITNNLSKNLTNMSNLSLFSFFYNICSKFFNNKVNNNFNIKNYKFITYTKINYSFLLEELNLLFNKLLNNNTRLFFNNIKNYYQCLLRSKFKKYIKVILIKKKKNVKKTK